MGMGTKTSRMGRNDGGRGADAMIDGPGAQFEVGDMGRNILAEQADVERAVAGKTLCSAFAQTVERHPDAPAIKWKSDQGWEQLTWREYRERVRDCSLGLRMLGFTSGGFGVLLSRNRPEHVIGSHALVHAGGTPVGLYTALAPTQIAYIANHCEATVAVVDAEGLGKLLQVRSELPQLERVVLMERDAEAPDNWVITWDEVLRMGRAEHERDPYAFERSAAGVTSEDLAALIYTSGTSGPPKGVMITHRNALLDVEAVERIGRAGPGDRLISFLPLAHGSEHWLSLWRHVVRGTTTYFCPDLSQLVATLREVRPTWFLAPPRIWEKLRAAITAVADSEAYEARHVSEAIQVGLQVVACEQKGSPVPAELARRDAELRPVRSGILREFGLDCCRVPIIGAAPSLPEVIAFFHALGLKLSEGWGMTEITCVGSWNGLERIKIGSVGPTVPGLEARISDDGELLVRGGTVMAGYYRDPERTAKAIDDEGWLHTGDVAEVDEDGYYRIVDRKKELIISAYGKNISPVNLENLIKRHPLIGQVCVVGDGRDYVSALIVLDGQVLHGWAKARPLEWRPGAELCSHPDVLAEIQGAVDATNEHLSAAEQIRRFTILPTEWTIEGGELTPTLKLKRRAVQAKYARAIEAMYEADGDPPVNANAAGQRPSRDRVDR